MKQELLDKIKTMKFQNMEKMEEKEACLLNIKQMINGLEEAIIKYDEDIMIYKDNPDENPNTEVGWIYHKILKTLEEYAGGYTKRSYESGIENMKDRYGRPLNFVRR